MRIGVPKEIKVEEYRVGLTPQSVRALCGRGHRVLVQSGAGEGIGAGDGEYRAAGAAVVARAQEVFAEAELVVKVKEPLASERALLRPGQALFAYLHLAPDAAQARDLVASGALAIAYESVTAPAGGLPLLAPMSEVAGRMAIQVAAHYLERPHGGRGVLLPGAGGVPPAMVLVLGAGVVGTNAARVADGMGARVRVLSRSQAGLRRLAAQVPANVETGLSDAAAVRAALAEADAVVGAALVPGAVAPKLVSREMLPAMRKGAVLVDVSIDQGGCFETSRPTTHADPVFVVDGIVHYCVANMPGAVPRTSAHALNLATLPRVAALADFGIVQALRSDAGLRDGLTVCRGAITRPEVAAALGYPYVPAAEALERV
ncbi:MAG TPA: alanine dehydrogenase [Burkholderiales bacterium]|nr:alanine dehydrogenase [Burkholderiales bacterium]